MKKIIIFGTTVFSKMVARYIEMEQAATVVAFCVDEAYIDEREILGKPVVAFEKVDTVYPPSDYEFLNAVGYIKMNSFRQTVTQKCMQKGYKMCNYISNKAIVYIQITGYNNIVLPGAFVGFDVDMGNNNIIYSGCMLTHNIKIGSNNFLAANSTFGGSVEIGDNCFVGLNATVKNSVKIGNKCLVGAGAYINKNVQSGKVIVPAKNVILDKDSEEFI